MAAGSWTFFNSAKEYIGDGTIDLDTHTFKALLLTSSYTPDATDATVTDLVLASNEAANYTQITLSGVTWTRSSGTCTFTCTDPVFTASGGTCTAKYAVIFDDTAASDELLCYIDLDTGGGSVSVATGNTLTIVLSASGIFQLS